MRTRRDFDMAVGDPVRAAHLARWFMRRRRLGGYKVALEIMDSDEVVSAPPFPNTFPNTSNPPC